MEVLKLKETVRYDETPETELLAECRSGGIRCVIARNMASVSRTAAGFMDFLGKLRSCGVELRLEKEGLCLKP